MDREIERRPVDDDDFRGVQIVDATTDRVLFEQKVSTDVDPIELNKAVFEQFDVDPEHALDAVEHEVEETQRAMGMDPDTSDYRYEP